MTKSVAEIIRAHAHERPEKTAFIVGERRVSYAELDSESGRAARALGAAGVGPQDRVAFLDKNAFEYFPLLLGAARLNAVTVAVNWRLAPTEIAYILRHAGAKFLLIGSEFLQQLDQLELARSLVVAVNGDSETYPSWNEWIGGLSEDARIVASSPEDTCYQLYTSGTTGLPKGVELSYGNLDAALSQWTPVWQFDDRTVSIVAMPLFHVAGSLWGLAGLYAGGTNVLLRELDSAKVLRTIEAHRVTNALFVPAVMQMLLAEPTLDDTDFSALRSVVYGASPISEEIQTSFMRRATSRLTQVYGLTETTGAATVLSVQDHEKGVSGGNLLRSAGRPGPGVELRIVDPETGKDVADGIVGEVWIRTAQNLKGYWQDPEATSLAYPEGRESDGTGWFRSGDAGYIEDGYLFIHDRVKDMIVSGGENIYPAEVENVLMAHPQVVDVAVIGVPDERWGETVKAMIVPADDADPDDAELFSWCRERLGAYKCPTSIDRIDAIPRNPSGKILKTELRKPFWKGHERMVG